MQIELKRTKLTQSMIKQTTLLTADEILLGGFEVVGWCRIKVDKRYVAYVLFQHKDSKELRRLKKFYKVEEDSVDNVLFVYCDSVSSYILSPLDEAQRKLFIGVGWGFIKNIKEKGQFYV